MQFKKNITITIACVVTECLLSLFPVILMIYLLFIPNKIHEIFSTLFIVPYFIVIINTILLIISFVAGIFIRTKYYVNEKALTIKNGDKVKDIFYSEISDITYDFGDLTKYHTKASQLCLFDKDHRQLFLIDNPPIIMVHMIRHKCKTAKMSYYNNKRFLYLAALINGVCFSVFILAKLFT